MVKKLNVNPNRMELQKLKRKQKFAVRGHKLLKDKQESLMQEFMKILGELKGLYQEVEEDLMKTYESYFKAQVGADQYALEEALESPKQRARVKVIFKNKMGGKTPYFELSNISSELRYGAGSAPLAMRDMVDSVSRVLPRMIFLAQVEKQIEMLAGQIEKTRRRVNALEHNLIPAIQETMRDIVMKLEERDRAERTTLMKVKELLEKQEAA